MDDDTFKQMRARLEADKKYHEKQEDYEKSSVAGEVGQVGMKDRFSYLMPIPDDLWIRCPACQGIMLREDFEKNHSVCLHCGHCFRVNARERITMTADEGSFTESWVKLFGKDPISFPRYDHRLSKLQEKTGMRCRGGGRTHQRRFSSASFCCPLCLQMVRRRESHPGQRCNDGLRTSRRDVFIRRTGCRRRRRKGSPHASNLLKR